MWTWLWLCVILIVVEKINEKKIKGSRNLKSGIYFKFSFFKISRGLLSRIFLMACTRKLNG